MPQRLRTVIVGTGDISREHLAFVERSECARLVGVCDLSPAAARFAAERYGADHWSTDLDGLLASSAPDVVHVLTPPGSHVAVATQALEGGAHVIVEKPIALSAGALRELLAVADRTGHHVTEDHNYLFNRRIRQLGRLVDAGALGEITDVEVRMAVDIRAGAFGETSHPHPVHRLPAGAIHDFLTHLAYLAVRFAPGPFDAEAVAWRNHDGVTGDIFKFDDLDALVLAGRRHLRIRFSSSTWPECLLVTVRGTEGQAEAELFQPSSRTTLVRAGGRQLSSTVNHLVNGAGLIGASMQNLAHKLTKVETPYHGMHRFLEATYDALLDGSPLPVGRNDMIAAAELIDGLLSEEVRL